MSRPGNHCDDDEHSLILKNFFRISLRLEADDRVELAFLGPRLLSTRFSLLSFQGFPMTILRGCSCERQMNEEVTDGCYATWMPSVTLNEISGIGFLRLPPDMLDSGLDSHLRSTDYSLVCRA